MGKYIEKKVGKATVKIKDFGSIHEFTDFLDKAPLNEVFANGSLSSRSTGDSRWAGTNTYEEAEKLFREGYLAVASRLAKAVPVSTTSAPARRSKPTFSVVGGHASVPRYIQGIPTNMIHREPVVVKNKIIVINRDISFSANTSATAIEEEGIKALAIVKALENKGFRVKLNIFFAGSVKNETIAFRTTIKKPEERLSLSKVAFPLVHPSILRRFGLAFVERFPDLKETGFRYGYGMPDGAKLKEAISDDKEIFLPNFIRDVNKFIESL
jgi:hypothetical protein